MVLPATLPRSSFADLLRINDVQFVQQYNQQRSMAGGEVYYADRAPALWQARCTTVPMEHAEAEGIMALINSRAGGLKSVLLYNSKLPFPASDPEGALFGAATPTLNAIADRLHTSFSGFPAGYVLPLGTYFQVTWDGGARLYLGQLVESRTANPITGAVASTEIWPPLPAGIATGAPVTVARPCAKFRIVPGTAYPAVQDVIHSVITFTAEQTYAA